ncbi:MAG: type II toxin-antitoxin system HicA family toxin [Proteobacteria bacterium]|nr:type II toxin-antitoxin system HicA family toxin [Pseudomonadota bacterium]MBU4120802.1 type II toxin-antitoxin system HicA family toxin [Pseudomonadota bacterium]
MPELRNLSGRDVCAILSRHGFVKVRQRGSHIVMQKKKEEGTTITVPVPDHEVILIG